MNIFKNYNYLLKIKLYSLKNKNKIFYEIINNLTKFHYKNCSLYKKILDGFHYNYKKNIVIDKLLFLPIRLFKNYELKSVDQKKIIKVLRSSGTAGNVPSKIFLDKQNSYNQILVLNKIIKYIVGDKRLPMLIIDKKTIISKNNEMNARMAAINGFGIFGKEHTYFLKDDNKIDYINIKNFLQKYSRSKFLIFGFTHLIYENLIKKFIKKKNILDLSNGIILHGGGWKKLENKKITNKKFKSILKNKFNIKEVINYYGLVEQTGSIFLECGQCSRFITSEFSDIIIRNKNLEICKTNEKGTIQTISILPTSYPGHNILTEDIGEIKGENNCKCGKLGKYFLVHGRIKQAEIRGCSNVA
jgi:phenylacetate-coenzyme A ligase PaaK-like adenylate-forming protein